MVIGGRSVLWVANVKRIESAPYNLPEFIIITYREVRLWPWVADINLIGTQLYLETLNKSAKI